MCGIGAILRVYEPGEAVPEHRVSIPEHWLDVLDDSVARRGPDGAGRFRDRAYRDDGCIVDVALVHRRLSIIDHAGGAQPMAHVRHAGGDGELLRPDRMVRDPIGGRPEGIAIYDAFQHARDEARRDLVCAAFNGCIYNHREVRAELEAAGHRFVSDHSDTEVLVHGWRAWGTGWIEQADGMFASLVWSRERGLLSVSRDRFGEKPLYATPLDEDFDGESARFPQDSKSAAFCSMAGGLLRLRSAMGRVFSLSQGEVSEWLTRGWRVIASPTYKCDPVPSGASAVWGFGAPRECTERSIDVCRPPARDESLGITECEQVLRRSVEERLEADTEVGCFLSGGIDSSLVTKFAHEASGRARAFTVRMPADGHDESDAAAEVAKLIGCEHSVLDCHADPAADVVELIEWLGLPFGDSSLLPTHWVSSAAGALAPVALGGDGGDELFAGYRRHLAAPWLTRLWPWAGLIPPDSIPARRPNERWSRIRRLISAARDGRGRLRHAYASASAIFQGSDGDGGLAFASVGGAVADIKRVDRPATELAMLYDLAAYLPGDILRKGDTGSMACALEVRSPFLARGVVDHAMRAPVVDLLRGGRKGLLRAVARKFLPDHIVDRPKQGFAIPIGEWFRTDYGGMRTLMLDHLRSADPFPGLGDAGVEIDLGFVERLIAEHDAAGERSLNPWRGRDHSQRLYMLVVMSIWSKWLERVRSGDGSRAAAVDPFAVV